MVNVNNWEISCAKHSAGRSAFLTFLIFKHTRCVCGWRLKFAIDETFPHASKEISNAFCKVYSQLNLFFTCQFVRTELIYGKV